MSAHAYCVTPYDNVTFRIYMHNQILNMAADDQTVCIKDLRPGMKNVTCVFIVIDRG